MIWFVLTRPESRDSDRDSDGDSVTRMAIQMVTQMIKTQIETRPGIGSFLSTPRLPAHCQAELSVIATVQRFGPAVHVDFTMLYATDSDKPIARYFMNVCRWSDTL
jgi:hypothetical protein